MIIPNKHSGYQAGIRLYPAGGGDGGAGGDGGTGDAASAAGGATGPAAAGTGNGTAAGGGDGGGFGYGYGGGDVYTNPMPTSMGTAPTRGAITGMPFYGGSSAQNGAFPAQVFQPVYQPQYQDYNMGNRMGVSQYGQGFGNFNPYAMQMQMQTPFNPYTNNFGFGMASPFMQQAAPMPQMSPFRSSGPVRPIVSRSAGMRGTPNVMMRRAEGGIAALVDDE